MVKKCTNLSSKLNQKCKYYILITESIYTVCRKLGESYMAFRKKLKNLLDHIPLWMQLALFTTLVTFFVLFYLIYTDYKRNLQVITNTQTDTSNRLLAMEMQNLEKYIQELSLFCIQSCYDHTFTRIVEKDNPILPEEETYLKNQMKAYFYSRSDLESFDFYLMNHARQFSRTQNGIRSYSFSLQEVMSSEYYQECLVNPYFHAILPAEENGVLFHYYHSLLRIKTKQPQALVDIAVSNAYWHSLSVNHTIPGEFICLLDENGRLLHTENDSLSAASSQDLLPEISGLGSGDCARCMLDGQAYLVTCAEGSTYHMKLLAFLPVSYIDDQIVHIRYSILISGLLISLAALLLITVLIRLLTNPLTILANKLVNVGNGDFTSPANISGSLEISNLSHSFNDMILHIDKLIKKNYIAELGEKNARITALEAQLNPHFLYNTLQAIATEALINDQTQIYNMITSLASGLRYTIKGGDFVPLYQEMDYVKNYVLLQKMRMDDRLDVTFHNAPETKYCIIPKISIQVLVENSILHGIGPEKDSIAIEISSELQNEYLYITIRDNGCGIKPQQLADIRESFRTPFSSSKNRIGLANLYGRLHLLYQEKADMTIESQPGSYTVITVTIPATKEVPHV